MINLKLDKPSIESHYLEVSKIIKNRISTICNDGGIFKGKGATRKKIVLSPGLNTYLTTLNKDSSLKALINCKAENLENKIKTLKVTYPTFFTKGTPDYLIIYNLFVVSAYNNLKKYDFIKKIGVDTCPYCNRNYIYALDKKSKIKPQIDHFYPKGLFPVLAVSCYNLVPSCQTCNGFGAKEEKDPHKYLLKSPYLYKIDDIKFSYNIKSINILNPLINKSSIDVLIKTALTKHLDVFKIKEFYNLHSDHVLELIIKSQLKYSDEYRKHLKSFVGLKLNDKEIDRMIIGNYADEDEIHKRPLAKLYQDIGRELNLIK